MRNGGRGICGLRRGASHRTDMSLSRLSTAACYGCQGSSPTSRRACRYLHRSALCVMQSAGKLPRSGRCLSVLWLVACSVSFKLKLTGRG